MIIDTSNALAAPGSSRGYACLSVALRSIAGSAAAPWPGDGRTSGAAGVPRRPLPRAFVPLSADSGSAPKLPAPGAPALRSSSRRWLAGARRVRSGPARRWGETPVGGRRGPRPRPSRAGGCLRVGTARYRAVAAARARRACRGRGSSPSPPPLPLPSLPDDPPPPERPPAGGGGGGARSRPGRGVPCPVPRLLASPPPLPPGGAARAPARPSSPAVAPGGPSPGASPDALFSGRSPGWGFLRFSLGDPRPGVRRALPARRRAAVGGRRREKPAAAAAPPRHLWACDLRSDVATR